MDVRCWVLDAGCRLWAVACWAHCVGPLLLRVGLDLVVACLFGLDNCMLGWLGLD